jgi:hypothetical protein
VFLRPEDSEYAIIGVPLFIGDSDRLVVPVTRPAPEPGADDQTDLEIWKIASPVMREKVIRNVRMGWPRQATTSGRIAWTTFEPNSYHVDVFDLDAERVIISTPATDRDPKSRYVLSNRFRLSSTGRALMSIPPSWLWDVDSGKTVWYPKSSLSPQLIDGADLFEVEELWDRRLPALRLGEWRTAALYDLDTASLQFRCWNSEAAVLQFTNADFTLGVSRQGSVHRLPFRANWPLLVLCQIILASPLILLSAIFHYRKRRAARRQPAVAYYSAAAP